MSFKKTFLFSDAAAQKETKEDEAAVGTKRQREEPEQHEEVEEESCGDPFLREEEADDKEYDKYKEQQELPPPPTDTPQPLLKEAAACEWKSVADAAQVNEVWKFTVDRKKTHLKETFLVLILEKVDLRDELLVKVICASGQVMYNTNTQSDEGCVFPNWLFDHIGAERIE